MSVSQVGVLIATIPLLGSIAGFDPAKATSMDDMQFAARYVSCVDNRLYRHCHIVGSSARVVCMTADPWSPEHKELERRQRRFEHEGGPNEARRKNRTESGQPGVDECLFAKPLSI